MKEATLLLLFRGTGHNREVLLAQKKRGFGQGKWNGPGGKVNVVDGETPEAGIIRETQEEIGIEIQDLKVVAVFDFIFTNKHELDMHCTAYTTETFTGTPSESEEMAPKWFKISEIPFSEMWDGDELWIPQVIAGKKLKATMEFNEEGKVTSHKFEELL